MMITQIFPHIIYLFTYENPNCNLIKEKTNFSSEDIEYTMISLMIIVEHPYKLYLMEPFIDRETKLVIVDF